MNTIYNFDALNKELADKYRAHIPVDFDWEYACDASTDRHYSQNTMIHVIDRYYKDVDSNIMYQHAVDFVRLLINELKLDPQRACEFFPALVPRFEISSFHTSRDPEFNTIVFHMKKVYAVGETNYEVSTDMAIDHHWFNYSAKPSEDPVLYDQAFHAMNSDSDMEYIQQTINRLNTQLRAEKFIAL